MDVPRRWQISNRLMPASSTSATKYRAEPTVVFGTFLKMSKTAVIPNHLWRQWSPKVIGDNTFYKVSQAAYPIGHL